jgi:HD superfamily phosphohydrolase
VYYLARRLIANLAERGADAWLSPGGVRSMLCAALLHDIGHFPYAHSLNDLPLAEHEALGAALIASEPLRSLIGEAGADPDMTAAIVDSGAKMRTPCGEVEFYRKLLSGALDPDKLDYLNRDARFCGVPYGAQDVDFILSILYPHRERGLEIDSRGIASVESVLFSKYLMYRSVYWHHSVRAATSMMKKALFAALRDGELMPDDLYGLDDEGFFALLASRKHSFFTLVALLRRASLYAAASEAPFDSALHAKLVDIAAREEAEAALAEKFSAASGARVNASQVIIDVPERAVFETNLFVRDEGVEFGGSSSFFKAGTVEAFANTLRVTRLFLDRPLLSRLPAAVVKDWAELLK